MPPLHDSVHIGDIAHIPAGEDLTGKEAHLLELSHDSGAPEFILPTAETTLVAHVCIYGNEDAELVTARPLESGKQIRIRAKGAGNPGDRLCLADPSTAADKGKVRALPAAAATYRCFAIAEETFVDGQVVAARYTGPEDIVVE